MKGEFTVQNAFSFAKEYQTENFGYIKWSEVLNKNRKVIIFIVKNIDDVKPFMNIATENSENYYWSRITATKYKEFEAKINDTSLPAAIISNSEKTKYVIAENVTPEKIMEIIEKP